MYYVHLVAKIHEFAEDRGCEAVLEGDSQPIVAAEAGRLNSRLGRHAEVHQVAHDL